MSPLAGRFLGRDPIGFEGSKAVTYEYLTSRALIGLDPSGNCDVSTKGSAVCNPGGCETGRGAISGTITPLFGYMGLGLHTHVNGAQLNTKYKHDRDKFVTPNCECCCCSIRVLQRIDHYERIAGFLHIVKTPIDFDGSRGASTFYPMGTGWGSDSQPFHPYDMTVNKAFLEDSPTYNYNPLGAGLFGGYPNGIRIKGTACAVCASGREGPGKSLQISGKTISLSMNSLTIYGCMEWEITLFGAHPQVNVLEKSMKEVTCQHVKFFGKPFYSHTSAE
jgi:hypothetical protein